MESVWTELGLKRTSQWASEGGFIGVGEKDTKEPEPLWTDKQLGVHEVVKEIKAKTSGPGSVGVVEALLEKEAKATARAVAASV
jgi:5-aminolevulinate synthase